MNRPIINKKTESVIKNLLARKAPGPDINIDEFYHIFKEELIPEFLKLHSKK